METIAILIALILQIIMDRADIQADIIKRIPIMEGIILQDIVKRDLTLIQTVEQVLMVITPQAKIRTINTIADMEAAIIKVRVIITRDILIQATILPIITREAAVSGVGLKTKLFHHQINLNHITKAGHMVTIPLLKVILQVQNHINPILLTKDTLIRAHDHINPTLQAAAPILGQDQEDIQAQVHIPLFHTPLLPLIHPLPIQPLKREINNIYPQIDC